MPVTVSDATATHAPPSAPLRIGPPDDFATVRTLLAAAEYEETHVARRLGGQTLYGVPRLVDGRKSLAGPVEDANAALVRLFIDGETVSAALAESLLGVDGVHALGSLGLVAPAAGDAAALRASVMLYPTQGLWLVSDRQPMGPGERMPQDYVFSAINELTHEFLSLVPPAPGARVLELCAGTGVAALRAVRQGATEAWATDVAPRCAHYTRFNAHLNGLADRVTVVQSDVWDALAGETFDLVVAHPPYVPALAHRFDFRDAGGDGERVTERIVGGLAAHVREGGRFVMRAALTDRTGADRVEAPIASRLRAWLGEASAAFDMVILERGEYGPMDAYRNVTNGGVDFVDCERWLRHFGDLGVTRFAVCAVELRREVHGRAPVTERRVAGAVLDHRAVDWHFNWARFVAVRGETPLARLGTLRPRVAAGVRLAVHLESDAAAEWHTVGAAVETGWPSRVLVKAPPLTPTLLELCDGTRDVPALLAGLRAAGLVGDDVSEGDVAHLVEVLAAAGAVAVPECPIPAPATA